MANGTTSSGFNVDDFLSKKQTFSVDQYLSNQNPQPPASLSISDMISMAVDNLGPSAVQAGKDLVTPFVEPVETAKALGNLALGTAQKVISGEQSSEKYADAVGQFFANRYGGVDELKNTIAKDPAGFLLDFSAILSGGGTLAARAPGKVGKIAKTARAVGDTLDPITMASKVAGNMTRGVVNPAVTRLMRQGVTPTMGQILGGGVKKAEEALGSVPVLGSAIGAGQQRATEQLNRAAMARALNPIGKSAKNVPVGSQGLAHVSDKLSDAYNRVLPKVSLSVDDALIDGIADAVASRRAEFEPAKLQVIEKLLDEKVLSKLDSDRPIPGKQLQAIQEDLKKLSDKYGKSGMASERTIGEAIEQIEGAFRDGLIRSNPEYAAELSKINEGYANYVRLRRAALAAGEDKGADLQGFTPAQLRQAVKAEDQSVGKGDFARGRALMQDLSQDAQSVMGGKLPTSGTAERAILASALAGGAYLDPAYAATVASLSAPYLPGAQRVMAGALTQRPEIFRTAGQAMRTYGPRIGRPAFQMGRINRETENR